MMQGISLFLSDSHIFLIFSTMYSSVKQHVQPRLVSNFQWEQQKDTITRLYAIEDTPLKNLVEIMRRQYSFYAK